jgi:hypothetical protein
MTVFDFPHNTPHIRVLCGACGTSSAITVIHIRRLSVTTIIVRREQLQEKTRLRLYVCPRSLAGYGLDRQILLWLAHLRLRRLR